MPKMGDIMKLKKQLKEKIAELNTSAEADSVKISNLELAIADLDNSHEEMMGWMRQFNRDYESMVNEEILKYLNEQKEKIEKVGEVTNAALQNAQEQLAE
jgi:chromosome segregation ATPase